MLNEHATIVVVGGGQAGARAALSLRANGFAGRVSLLCAEDCLPYERPILSKQFLMDREHAAKLIATEADYRNSGIDLRLGCLVTAIDRDAKQVRLASGEDLAYDRLLLATGSSVRQATIPGWPQQDICYLRTLDDATKLRARIKPGSRLVVLGGGFIGLEVAATAVALGAQVTVVEAAPQLIARLGCPEASAEVLAHHRRLGVDVLLGDSIIGGTNGVLTLRSGRRLEADLIVAGVGVIPSTALAAEAGLVVDDGILVDENGRTSDPFIHAAGDVTRHFRPRLGRHVRLESWQNANSQADVAARDMLGLDAVHDETPWLWSDQGSLNFQSAGVPEAVDCVVTRRAEDPDDGVTFLQLCQGRMVGGITVNRGKDMAVIRRILARPDTAIDPARLGDMSVALRRFL